MPARVWVCVSVYMCMHACFRACAKETKEVAAIPSGITKIFNLPFMTPN